MLQPVPLLAQAVTATFTRSQLRWELLHLAIGVVLLVSGCLAIALFFFRRKTRELTLLYFGLFSLLYGARLLVLQGVIHSAFALSPGFWGYVDWFITCTINLPFNLFLYQLAGELLRKLLRVLLTIQAVFAVLGIFAPFVGVKLTKLQPANNILVLATLLTTGLFILLTRRRAAPAKPLSREIRVFIAGFFIWILFVLHANLFSLRILPGLDVEFLGFFVFVGCLGYVAAYRTFANEERLLALNTELEIARQIQACTLPQSVPALAGLEIAARYVPMSAVAGDFYDFLALDDKRVGVLIADVTGHGVPAALIASMLKVAFAEQFYNAEDPARLLAGVNRSLCGKFEEHFVTAAYVFVDLEKNVMRYAGAGHPPLMLASRAPSSTVRQVEQNGLMLGLFPDAAYSATEIPLRPGDRCLLYTDGAFEAMNSAHEEFGKARLEQFLAKHAALPADRFATAFLDEISRWVGPSSGQRQDDDITLLVLDFQHSLQAGE